MQYVRKSFYIHTATAMARAQCILFWQDRGLTSNEKFHFPPYDYHKRLSYRGSFDGLSPWTNVLKLFHLKIIGYGSGCDSVGRSVVSESRGPWFESSQWQKIILNMYSQLYWKDKNKEKEGRKLPIFIKIIGYWQPSNWKGFSQLLIALKSSNLQMERIL